MADISPVRDPNFENWNYAANLDRAVQPLQTLGQGRLAIAQQQGQRMFEMASQRQTAALQAQNRISELQAEEAQKEKYSASETARLKQELLNKTEASAKQANPNYTGRDPNKTDDENIATAQNAIDQKTAEGAKKLIDAQNVAKGQAMGLIDEYGKPVKIDDAQLGSLVANDPQFVNRLNAAQKQALSDGSMPVSKLIDSLSGGKIASGFEGLLTGVNPRSLRSDLASAAQTARQTLMERQRQIVGAKLGLSQQELQSRANTYNELFPKVVANLPPHMIADVMDYASKTSAPLGVTPPTAPGNPSLYNKDGTLKSIAGDKDNPPSAANPIATPGQYQPGAAGPPATATPGTPPALDPETWRQQGDLLAAVTKLKSAQSAIESKQQEADTIRHALVTGVDPSSVAPDWMASSSAPPGMAPFGSAFQPFEKKLTPQQGETLADRLLQLNKEIEGHKKDAAKFEPDAQRLQMLIQSKTAPPPVPSQGQFSPQGDRYNSPANIVPQGQQSSVTPWQPPQQQITQPGQPQANNVDPMQVRAVQNKIAQAFGTSDPNQLNAIKQYAHSTGLDDNAVAQMIQGVVQDNPQAIQMARSLASKVQQQNQGQLAQSSVQPQQSFSPMSFGA